MKEKEITTTNQCKTKLNDIQCSLFITYKNERSIEIFNFVHWFAENTNKMKIHKSLEFYLGLNLEMGTRAID